jgi:hypothetical protein
LKLNGISSLRNQRSNLKNQKHKSKKKKWLRRLTLLNKPINEITKNDLVELITIGVLEHKTLEYKQSLPGNSDTEKEKFLAEVSSLANTSGGDIVYGMTEDRETGKPKSLEGLDITNYDQEKLRLENMMRMGIQPRIPSVNISPPILLDNSKIALVIRVSKSWISPHRVLCNDKFYSRNSSGKYPLDVSELRTAFNLSETIIQKIRSFRIERLNTILSSEIPIPLIPGPKIVCHIIPITSLESNQVYNIENLISHQPTIYPLNQTGGRLRYNLDGLISYFEFRDNEYRSYSLFFRNGVVEGVDASVLHYSLEEKIIPSLKLEQEIIGSTKNYLLFLKSLAISSPMYMFFTLIGVKGYSLAVSRRYFVNENYKIDRDILSLPEIFVDSLDIDETKLLKPVFDSLWNACGFKRSFDYNEQGEWVPR